MLYGLGIDAGGTYTDAVVIDFKSQKVISKGKALTTKHDLGIGIANALGTLPPGDLKRIDLVSLSTTLATNAIVEGMGNLVGALLLGFDNYDMAKIAHKPAIAVPGRTDILGAELEPLDESRLRRAVEEMERDEHVAAYAVSGMVAVKNPSQELRAKRIVEEMTGKSVVCGHEVSMELDSIKRTNTAILNARLLPIIADLIDRMKAMMGRYGLNAPLMIVRADGTLMTEEGARRHPVETILSGPAASVCGASFLTGIRDGLVVDIGGTTSDIALILDGKPVISARGATVADWTTHVRAVDIDTLGLAGDSVVTVSRDRQLYLGPRRAVPLSVLAGESENVVGELERIWEIRSDRSSLIQPVEFFVAVKGAGETMLTDTERRTLDALADGPLSRDALAERIKVIDPSMVPTNRMETLGLIRRSALTPTDVLHVRGIFTRWNTEAARWGLRLVADRLKLDEETLEHRIMETFTRQSVRYLVGRLLRHPGGKFDEDDDSPMLDRVDEGLTELLLSGKDKLGFSLKPVYVHPLIAIGAPAYALAPAVAQRLGAELVVPEHADVANAVGAITGMQTITVEALVSATETGYLSYTPAERKDFEDLDAAMEWTKVRVMELLELKIREEGQRGLEYRRELQVRDNVAQVPTGDFFLESAVRGVGFCKPALG